jgi:hypothetical protein
MLRAQDGGAGEETIQSPRMFAEDLTFDEEAAIEAAQERSAVPSVMVLETVVALPIIALAAGFTMFAAANFWAACIDLAPGYSASLSALMNTVGSLGGVISSTVTASIAVPEGGVELWT